MKKIILISILSFFSFGLFAQYNAEKEGLYSRYRPGIGWFYSGLKPYQTEKLRKYDRLMVDLVYNDWYGDKEAFQSPWQSIGVNISLLFDIPFTKGNTVGMGVGITYSHYNNRSKYKFTRDFKHGTTLLSNFEAKSTPKKARFGANYIGIPIELRFRTKGYKHFKVMIGGKIEYRINSYSKETYKVDGKNYAEKQYRFIDSNPLRYGATFRIGIRNWALFGAYYFSPLFTNNKSVQLYPFSLGITISLF